MIIRKCFKRQGEAIIGRVARVQQKEMYREVFVGVRSVAEERKAKTEKKG